MAPGLDALIEAANFLEQQEKLKLSPQQNNVIATGISATPVATNNDTRYATISYENGIAAITTTNIASNSAISHNNDNNNTVSIRNYGIGHRNQQQQHHQIVSSSAPAAAPATFQHQNTQNLGAIALTISSNNKINSQLHQRQHRNTSNSLSGSSNIAGMPQDFEFTKGSNSSNVNGGVATIIRTTTPSTLAEVAATLTNNGSRTSSYNNVNSISVSNSHSHAMMVDDTHIDVGGVNGICGTTKTVNVNGSGSTPTSNSLLIANNNSISPLSFPQQVLTGTSQQLQQQQSGSTTTSVMLSGSQGTHTHITPTIGGSGRRRTISSNSNGAGTREVHNKLEKNRRAHLKECYEALKNELPLKDDDRKKTSNLAILGEAHKLVNTLKKEDKNLEMESEQLSKAKISLQKRLSNLRRDLGAKGEDSGDLQTNIIFQTEKDFLSSIPNERDNLNDSIPLSSRRGSRLYGSSSSLSSGGSCNTTAISSPVSIGTTVSNAISPVITNHNSTTSATTTATILATSPHNMLQHVKNATVLSTIHNKSNTKMITNNNNNNINSGNISIGSPIVSPNVNSATIVGGPLSLTAKNISATAVTRGSPTPSISSPSPSSIGSSSGVSSSSSPPIVGGGSVLNGRNVVAVNIPNGTKFPLITTSTAPVIGSNVASIITTNTTTSSNSNGNSVSATTAIIANSNNALHSQYHHHNQKINQKSKNNNNNISSCITTNNASANANANEIIIATATPCTTTSNRIAPNSYSMAHVGRDTASLSIVATVIKGDGDGINCKSSTYKNGNSVSVIGTSGATSEDGEQPTKFLKVYNGGATPTPLSTKGNQSASVNRVQLSQLVSVSANANASTSLLVSAGFNAPNAQSKTLKSSNAHQHHHHHQQMQNVYVNGGAGGSNGNNGNCAEIGRLPGGAELNIVSNNGSKGNGNSIKQLTTFYHANGKLTFINNGSAATTSGSGCGVGVGVGVGGFGKAATPLFVAAPAKQYASNNFGQLIAASSTSAMSSDVAVGKSVAAAGTVPEQSNTAAAVTSARTMASMVPVERLNGKFRLLLGAQPESPPQFIKKSFCDSNNNIETNYKNNNNNNNSNNNNSSSNSSNNTNSINSSEYLNTLTV